MHLWTSAIVASLDRPDRLPPHRLRSRTRPQVNSGNYARNVSHVLTCEAIAPTRFNVKGVFVFWNWVSITCVAERAALVHIVNEGNGNRLDFLGWMKGRCMYICMM